MSMHTEGPNGISSQFLTKKLWEEDLFEVANERTDLRTSWLIIYPAGFMALINFPPLSLYLPLKLWSQRASGADNGGVSAASQAYLPTHPHTPPQEKNKIKRSSSGSLPFWIMPLKIGPKAAKQPLFLYCILGKGTAPPNSCSITSKRLVVERGAAISATSKKCAYFTNKKKCANQSFWSLTCQCIV